MSRPGTLSSINSSGGGVPKQPLMLASVNHLGIEGDLHRARDHGGSDRAICIYSLDLIRMLRGEGHPIDVGTAGENFTVENVNWELMVPGARLAVGDELKLEVTSFTNPCKTIAGSFTDGGFKRISQKVFPGWSRVYARVTQPGSVRPGDLVGLE